MYAAMSFQAGGAVQGQRLSVANQANLVMTGVGNGSPVYTAKNVNIKKTRSNFSNEELRYGAVSFITGDPFSSGAPVAAMTMA